jgi:hypothetical protein
VIFGFWNKKKLHVNKDIIQCFLLGFPHPSKEREELEHR